MSPAGKGPGMLNRSLQSFRSLFLCAVLLVAAFTFATANAQDCPTAADPIETDRPDVTNSSLVVPVGSLQVENGIDWNAQYASNAFDGTNTRMRLGIARCTEFVLDVPRYVEAFDGSRPSGFTNVIVSFKRQLPVPFGFDLSATAGLGFPSGSPTIVRQGYQPYIQFPWSYAINQQWEVSGMFSVIWFPSDSPRNPTFEPTFVLEREFGSKGDLFVEYVGDYDHERPSQLLDGGGVWRITRTQQLDFHLGFGLNSNTVDHYFGIGYSFRLDDLFGNSP
jgi:hypothetical protein